MGRAMDLTGRKIGNLLLIKRKSENNRTYYYCRCVCGKEKWIRADCINEKTSCGCRREDTQFKSKNLKGKRYGRLIALEETEQRDKGGSIIWKCRCECGNECCVSSSSLLRGRTSSCGCLQAESARKGLEKALEVHFKENIVEGTNIPIISRATLQSNNTSGVTGVMWDKKRRTWKAEITFKKKVYHLGRYKDKKEAIKVRQEAEKQLFGEFLEWYNKNKDKS